MLLFQSRFHQGLVDGSITLTFRQWPTARVKPGNRYRVHPIGVVIVEKVEQVRLGDVPDDDAVKAGFSDREALIDYIMPVAKGKLDDDFKMWRIELHHAGDGDFVPFATEANLTPEELQEIDEKLAKMDRKNPWTAETLELISRHPKIVASKLAKMVGRETHPFKTDVRKLKAMGLTQSFEIGYSLTPRGEAYFQHRKSG